MADSSTEADLSSPSKDISQRCMSNLQRTQRVAANSPLLAETSIPQNPPHGDVDSISATSDIPRDINNNGEEDIPKPNALQKQSTLQLSYPTFATSDTHESSTANTESTATAMASTLSATAPTSSCSRCTLHQTECQTTSGENRCKNCKIADAVCNLFASSNPKCSQCVRTHRKCETQIGHTVCLICQHRGFNCSPAPTDRAALIALRAPRNKTNMDKGSTKQKVTGGLKGAATDTDHVGGGTPFLSSSTSSVPRGRGRPPNTGPRAGAGHVGSGLPLFGSTPPSAARGRGRPKGSGNNKVTKSNGGQHSSSLRNSMAFGSPALATRPKIPPLYTVADIPDYEPPSLPMLSANPQATAPASAAYVKDEQEEVEDEEVSQYDTTKPPADNPTLPTFLCCDTCVYPGPFTNSATAGNLILRDIFKNYAAHYPAEWEETECSDDFAAWPTLISIVEVGTAGVRIYGVLAPESGYLIQLVPLSPKPEILGKNEVYDISKERFYRVPGGADFECQVHGKKFITYFLRYFREGQEFEDIDDEDADETEAEYFWRNKG